ncbi:MAG: acetyl-CoA hydrolase/transferase family protein [Bdellovibrionales bacterium]
MEILKSANELLQFVRPGHRVFVQGGAATPNSLLQALTQQASRLQNVEMIHLHTMGPATYAERSYRSSFRIANLFVGPNMRPHMGQEGVDYLPCFLSEIPALFRSRKRPLDVALIQVSPPDAHGYCSLGTSVDVAKAAVETAPLVLAQINSQMPRVHGDGLIHRDQIDYGLEFSEALPERPRTVLTDLELQIGQHVASLIEDGATLQVGIGSIPDATLAALKSHRHLGVHTEMWSDGVLDLIQCGAIDNSRKSVHPGKTVAGFAIGTRALYDYMHDNPSVVHLDIGYVNNPATIARNKKVAAINSAVEIDLTGQVCADSVGSRIISGVGGQMDFIRGASLSEGGLPIVAMTSRTSKGASRIVPTLRLGAGVVTTRAHLHFVATEYGICDLYGKTLAERAQALIRLAHPDDRESLERAWFDLVRRERP